MTKTAFDIELEKMREEAIAAGKKLSEASAKVAAETMGQAAEALEGFTKELREFGLKLDRWVEKNKAAAETTAPEDNAPATTTEHKDASA